MNGRAALSLERLSIRWNQIGALSLYFSLFLIQKVEPLFGETLLKRAPPALVNKPYIVIDYKLASRDEFA